MKKHLLSFSIFSLFLSFYGTQNVAASIISQPRNVTVCAGSTTVGFSVKTDVISTYQWQVNNGKLWTNLVDQKDPLVGVTIAGANTSSITFGFSRSYPLTTAFSGTTVRCVVTFKLINEYSSAAVTTVFSITSQPVGLDVVEDQPASFSITASGAGLTYQWQISQDGGATYYDILYATSSAYILKYVTIKDAGLYRCMVTNGICSARYSQGAALNVYPVMTIDKHPGKASGCEKGTAKFAIYATNATAYQWEVLYPKTEIWEPLKNGNESVYITEPLLTDWNGAQFHCVVSGGAGQTLTSYSGILYVNTYVSIYTHPSGAGKIVGESVTFNVLATGSVSSYQWQFKNVNISGATSSSYTIGSVQLSDAGDYRCIVYGICNSVTSNAATLAVTVPTYPNGWVKQTSGSGLNITTVSPISDLKAWAVTSDADKLLKTVDGGENWSAVNTLFSGYWHSIYFISESIGMVGGWNGISRTTDGGLTWTYTDLKTQFGLAPGDYFYIESIHFIDASNGWAVGQSGIIIKTTDGGANWTKRSFKNDVSPTPITDINLYSVFFADINNGYVGGQNGKLFKTSNAGVNWSELTSGTTGYIYDIVFLSATKGFFITPQWDGSINSTNDGGSTWTKVPSSTNMYLSSIDFVDANNGWAAGYSYIGSQKGKILKTFDGGATWVSQRIDNSTSLNEIRMFNADHGWAVGNAGEIHRTGKGGCYDPVVSLYADQTLCANQSYTLRADTFVNNYNSRYLWSNSSTAGNITVNSTATYSVTITNECGKTASDNALITFLVLPVANAGLDISICEGESAQLLATGGTNYSWSNAVYLDNSVISNPVATPPTGQATTFTVTVTDANGCNNTDAVMVTVNALPASDFTAPVYVCGTANGSFTYSGSASGKSFAWDFSGGTIASGSDAGPILVNWNELGDKLVSLTTTANNCSSAPTLKIVNIREKPTSGFEAPASTCGASSAVLFYTGSAPTDGALYSWGIDGGTITSGSGRGPIQVSWATQGTKALSLSVTQNECASDITTRDIVVAYPYEGEEVCLITIDLETGKNMVVWEKTHDVGITSYNVYREGTIQNSYDLLGNVPFDQITVFVDTESKPEQQQYKYKISAVDTCGNESAKSKWHKTMFLQYVSSVNGVNLNWQEYGVESGSMSFDSYAIFRGSDSTSLSELTTISASFLAYTDNTADALSKKMYYRVGGVKPNACDPAEIGGKKANSGPFLHSLSNLEDNRLQSTGVSNLFADALQLTVYPSPFTDHTTISYTLQKPSKMKVEIYNVVGEKIGVILEENQSAGAHKLEMKAEDVNYINGLYYLRIMVDEAVVIRKTMLTK